MLIIYTLENNPHIGNDHWRWLLERYDVFLIWARWIIIFSAECLIFDNVNYICWRTTLCTILAMIIEDDYDVFLIWARIIIFSVEWVRMLEIMTIYIRKQPSVPRKGLLTMITRKIYIFIIIIIIYIIFNNNKNFIYIYYYFIIFS